MAAASRPAYADVFSGSFPRPPLGKVDDDEHISILHRKFWGESINHDESEWVGKHGNLPEDDESDVVQGCFTLDLGIRNLRTSIFWVRKDYLRIYDQCDSYYEQVCSRQCKTRSIVITGQPGVGECFSS